LSKDQENKAKEEMYAKERAHERRRFFLRHTRPNKFGTQLCVQRPDGTRIMLQNIYQKSIDPTNLGKHQRQKSNAIHGKKNKLNKIETNDMLINEAALKQSDRDLLAIL